MRQYFRDVILSVDNATRNLRKMVEGVKAPSDLAERLYLDQAADFSYIISAISLLGLCTIALLFLDFRRFSGAGFRDTGMLAVCLCYLALMVRGRAWLKRVEPSGQDAKDYITHMARLLALLGLLWGVLIAIAIIYGTVEQRALIYGIAIGCVATPVLVSPVICAFAYWMPVSVSICIGLMAGKIRDPFAMLDLVAFIALTAFCILYLNRRLNERAIGAIRLEESSAVIKLLLRDFEENASDWLWETNASLEMQQVSQRLAQVAQRPATSIRGVFPRPCWAMR